MLGNISKAFPVIMHIVLWLILRLEVMLYQLLNTESQPGRDERPCR